MLDDLGEINLIYQPKIFAVSASQFIAYDRIVNQFCPECYAILFIDADEFVENDEDDLSSVSKTIMSLFNVPNVGAIDQLCFSGWIANVNGLSKNIKINIFVNEIYSGYTTPCFYRRNFINQSISSDGIVGFKFSFQTPLKSGDEIFIQIHGRLFQFPNAKYKMA